MDISVIKAEEVNDTTGIKIGNSNAPVTLIEFVNVRCPFCDKWFVESKQVLDKYIESGQLLRIVKPFNKQKPGLKLGNVLHDYLDFSNPDAAYKALSSIYATQSTWGSMTEESVAKFAENELGLTRQSANETPLSDIVAEAERANIVFVPTVIVGDKIFDEHITPDELTALIESKLAE